jgi:hypothetical protein
MISIDITENSAKLTTEQIDFMENQVLTNSMPWYINNSSVPGDGIFYFSHVLKHRKEDNQNSTNNSPATDFFLDLIKKVLEPHNLKSVEILRASLNMTFFNKQPYGTIHTDHNYEHSNFIMYFDTLENSGTVIFEEDKETIKYISESIKYNYIIFPGLYHAQLFPPPGQKRTVLVATFR